MKNIWKSILTCVVVMVAGLASAQTFDHFNPPPCDFTDRFYNQNGIDLTSPSFVGRFGDARQTGPPAVDPTQVNWVTDSIDCSTNDSTRRDIRILATTGAYREDNGAPTEFFSLIAFMVKQDVFEASFTDMEGTTPILIDDFIDTAGVHHLGTNHFRGTFDTPTPGIVAWTTQFLAQSFLAFAAAKQNRADGMPGPAPIPCAASIIMQNPQIDPNDCFFVGRMANGGLFGVDTPNLRQDWIITSNRNAIDGSSLNCIDPQLCCADPLHCTAQDRLRDSPFGYFCDDLLGTWLIHYWWFNENSIGGIAPGGRTIDPNPKCTHILECALQVNGASLDGTPIIKSGGQLNFLKGVPNTLANVFPGQGVLGACLQDSDLPMPPTDPVCVGDKALSPNGSDVGAVWIICPDLPDPRNGAIAADAFLDAVRLPNGTFQNQDLANNFNCLQQRGKFCNEP